MRALSKKVDIKRLEERKVELLEENKVSDFLVDYLDQTMIPLNYLLDLAYDAVEEAPLAMDIEKFSYVSKFLLSIVRDRMTSVFALIDQEDGPVKVVYDRRDDQKKPLGVTIGPSQAKGNG